MKKLFFLAVLAIFAASLSSAQVAEVSDTVADAEIDNDSAEFKKFQEAEYDMLCLIAHFEGVKVNAYWDNKGRVWTIGIGNTVHYSGRPVKSTDRIKDKDELMRYFSHHVEKYIFTDMQKYLPMAKMSKSDIAALGSLFYNTGSGILYNKDKTPSEFCRNLCEWFNKKSASAKASIAAYMDKKVYAKGERLEVLVKRRAVEEKIIFGEIIMDNTGEYALENSVNFAEAPLGGIYSVKTRDLDDNSFVCDSINNCPYGRNLNDSINWAFTHPNKPATAKKTTTAKRPRTKSKRR